MRIIAIVFCIFFSLMAFIPLFALADLHEIKTSPIQRCGLHCVIETAGFDTKKEADDFWGHYQTIGGIGGHEPYKINGSDLYFVDYQVVEDA